MNWWLNWLIFVLKQWFDTMFREKNWKQEKKRNQTDTESESKKERKSQKARVVRGTEKRAFLWHIHISKSKLPPFVFAYIFYLFAEHTDSLNGFQWAAYTLWRAQKTKKEYIIIGSLHCAAFVWNWAQDNITNETFICIYVWLVRQHSNKVLFFCSGSNTAQKNEWEKNRYFLEWFR